MDALQCFLPWSHGPAAVSRCGKSGCRWDEAILTQNGLGRSMASFRRRRGGAGIEGGQGLFGKVSRGRRVPVSASNSLWIIGVHRGWDWLRTPVIRCGALAFVEAAVRRAALGLNVAAWSGRCRPKGRLYEKQRFPRFLADSNAPPFQPTGDKS